MNDFPLDIHKALEEIAASNNMKMLRETHFEAINRELIWYEGSRIHRLNFNFNRNKKFVSVTYYVSKFPLFLARVLEWLHNYVPQFPYCARVTWDELPELPLDLSRNQYMQKIVSYIKRIERSEM